MGIAGVNSYNYANYYQDNVNRRSEQASGSFSTSASQGIVLHMSDGETGTKALTSVGFANGASASVFKADNYTDDNPQYLVKYWDENGDIQEYAVNPKEVDPSNASYIEMLAYSTYSDVQGYTTNAYRDFMSAAGGTSADLEYDSSNINEKRNFKLMVQEFMQMQYDAGNLSGYTSNKQFYEYMDSTDSKMNFSKALEQYGEQIKEKIKNGETEPTYQIGGQSFTETEWKKLIEKIDKDIEKIQEEQAERLEKEQAEQTEKAGQAETDAVSGTDNNVSEEKVQELLKDNNERRFEVYGPNAPEEVRQAWMKAAEETGLNGFGVNTDGQMSHISQLDVQRAIQWYNGENPDVLGTTVESAKQAVEKALYDLENPLEPITNRSESVQKSIEQEKAFYSSLLGSFL
ncbi:MAG: hypothetical protein Q4G60_14920 [bacterium]|nr:hypothetical protein [bacterium]